MLYQKIVGPYKRDMTTNKVVPGQWNSDAIQVLATVPIWQVTEKVDGTNVRVLWDGYRVSFGGRTERAELHKDLVATLIKMFPEERFEQTFGETPVVLFGEGYGAGIQKGGMYRQDKSFAMFDAAVNGKYLRPLDTEQLAGEWGIEHVPVVNARPWTLGEVIEEVSAGLRSRYNGGTFEAEGLVAKTYPGLLDHRGYRIIVKVKGVDFT
jgi:hypothetical protein